jgi:hypothetical protein
MDGEIETIKLCMIFLIGMRPLEIRLVGNLGSPPKPLTHLVLSLVLVFVGCSPRNKNEKDGRGWGIHYVI